MFLGSSSHYRCTDCKNDKVVYDNGDVICKECGLVLDDHLIDYSADWRTFASDADAGAVDKSHVGAAVDEMSELMKKHGKRVHEYRDILRTAQALFTCVNFAVLDQAIKYIVLFIDKVRVHGDDKRALVAGCAMYLASRTLPSGGLSKDEVCDGMSLDPSGFCKTCSELEKALASDPSTGAQLPARNLKVEDQQNRMLDVVAVRLRWDDRQRTSVWRVVNRFSRMVQAADDFAGTTTTRLTATLIYMSCRVNRMNVSVKHIAAAAGVSDSSIIDNEAIVMKIYNRLTGAAAPKTGK